MSFGGGGATAKWAQSSVGIPLKHHLRPQHLRCTWVGDMSRTVYVSVPAGPVPWHHPGGQAVALPDAHWGPERGIGGRFHPDGGAQHKTPSPHTACLAHNRSSLMPCHACAMCLPQAICALPEAVPLHASVSCWLSLRIVADTCKGRPGLAAW